MLKTINALNSLLGTTLGLVIVVLLGVAGYYGYRAYHADEFALKETQAELAAREAVIDGLARDLEVQRRQVNDLGSELADRRKEVETLTRDLETREEEIEELDADVKRKAEQIASLQADVQAKQREIEQLNTAISLLKIDHRVAQIDVLSQQGSAADGDLTTTVSFVEVDRDGKPLDQPRVFTIAGDVVYISSLVVKFSDEHVELGDPLRSTSVCLFQRIFGESQQPKDGFVLDPVGSQPAAYRTGGNMSDFEREIWSQFWEYANNSAKAKESGVRAAHGEAPFQKVVPNKRYRLELRASGGLTFVPEDLPSSSAADAL